MKSVISSSFSPFTGKPISSQTISQIVDKIKELPVQGGLNPKILLSDKDNIKKQTEKYLNIFKDHPYVFNLGHGILPETKLDMVQELIHIVRNFK